LDNEFNYNSSASRTVVETAPIPLISLSNTIKEIEGNK
jgi:hypothetical protein